MKNKSTMQTFERMLQNFAVDSRISNYDDLVHALTNVSKNNKKNNAFLKTVSSTYLAIDNDLQNKIFIVYSDNLGLSDRKNNQEITVQDIESSNTDDIIYFLSDDIKFKFNNISETVTAFQLTHKTDSQQENYFSERILSKMNYN